jgi:hypothetical protein
MRLAKKKSSDQFHCGFLESHTNTLFSKTWGILDIHVVDQGITFYKKVPKDGAWSKLYSLAGVVKKQRVLSDYIP